jgi:hypothetical protein
MIATPRTLRARRLASSATPRTAPAYEAFLKAAYGASARTPREVLLPSMRCLSVTGEGPPSAGEYQRAIAALYGVAYSLKMGLEFGQLEAPPRSFDYRVGALETIWWSASGGAFDMADADAVRWQALLTVPPFVSPGLVRRAKAMASAKHPDVAYDRVALRSLREGRVAQLLHVGPYDAEAPTIERLREWIEEHGLVVAGKHHEIYLSDPRRSPPAKLKTLIRLPVKTRRRAAAAR